MPWGNLGDNMEDQTASSAGADKEKKEPGQPLIVTSDEGGAGSNNSDASGSSVAEEKADKGAEKESLPEEASPAPAESNAEEQKAVVDDNAAKKAEPEKEEDDKNKEVSKENEDKPLEDAGSESEEKNVQEDEGKAVETQGSGQAEEQKAKSEEGTVQGTSGEAQKEAVSPEQEGKVEEIIPEKISPEEKAAEEKPKGQERPKNALPSWQPNPKNKFGTLPKILIVTIIAAIIIYYIASTMQPQKIIIINQSQGNLNQITACTSITKPGIYYVASDINTGISSGACLNVASSNVRIIGSGKEITGSGPFVGIPPFTYGIYVENESNVTISNLKITTFSYDVFISNSTYISFTGGSALNGTISGVSIIDSYQSHIEGDMIAGSSSRYGGLYLSGGSLNQIRNDTIRDNSYYGAVINSSGNIFQFDGFITNPVDLRCSGTGGFYQSNNFTGSACSVNEYCNFALCAERNTPLDMKSIELTHNIVSCGGISSSGSYVLDGNIDARQFLLSGNTTQTCIGIYANHVTLDCMSHYITGSVGYGILIEHASNVTLENCNVLDSTYGFGILNSFNSKIVNSSSLGSKYGAYISDSSTGGISNSTFTKGSSGIYLNSSSGFLFENIRSSNNTYGAFVNSGEDNAFSGGKLISNTKADLFCSLKSYNSTTNLFEGTSCGVTDCQWGTAYCKSFIQPPVSIYPVTACISITEPGNYSMYSAIDAGGSTCFTIKSGNVRFNCNGNEINSLTGRGSAFVLDNNTNVSIEGCKINNFATGMTVENTSYATIKNTSFSKTGVGIYSMNNSFATMNYLNFYNVSGTAMALNRTKSSVVNNITVSGTGSNGLVLTDSFSNLLYDNNIESMASSGFSFVNSTKNIVFNNSASLNGVDYICSGSSTGISSEENGVNYGTSKQNCRWMVELSPYHQELCYSIDTPTQIDFSGDMLYTYGASCYNIYSTSTDSGSGSVINCNGHTVLATRGGTFVNVVNATGVKIENCNLKNFTTAIASAGNETVILNNTITNSNESIITINAKNQTIVRNTIMNSSYGIFSQGLEFGNIADNKIYFTNTSIELSGGSETKITNNTVRNNSIGLYMLGSVLDTLQKNTFLGSSRYGIYCTGAAANPSSTTNYDLGENVCSSNSGCGWMLNSHACTP